MTPVNLEAYQATDIAFRIPVIDKETKAPIDITDYVFYFTLKANLDDADEDALIIKDVDFFEDPVLGVANITITYDDTKDLFGSYFYDFKLKDNNGLVRKIQFGRFKFIRTRTTREHEV